MRGITRGFSTLFGLAFDLAGGLMGVIIGLAFVILGLGLVSAIGQLFIRADVYMLWGAVGSLHWHGASWFARFLAGVVAIIPLGALVIGLTIITWVVTWFVHIPIF